MPTPAAISLLSSLQVGMTTTATDSTPAGTWSSDNTGVATIDSVTGIITGIAAGSANIIYTVGSDSIATPLNVIVNTISNGINFTQVYNALSQRITWQASGAASKSGRYFEDFHTLCNPTILMSMLPGGPFTGISDPAFIAAMQNEQRANIMEVVNQVYNAGEIIDAAQMVFERPPVTLYPQPVPNVGAVVGIRFFLIPGDRAYKLSSVELFFDSDVTFNLYLFNDMTWKYYFVQSVSAKAKEQVIQQLDTDIILNYMTPTANKGGVWYLVYFQNDLGAAQAMYYSIGMTIFHGMQALAFSAVQTIDPQGNRNFDRNIVGSNNLTYGLNCEMEVYRDATNNIIQNQSMLDDPLGYSMAVRIVKKLMFSFESNAIQRSIQGASLEELNRSLNGFKYDENSPYTPGLEQQASRAIMKAKKSFSPTLTRCVGH